MFYNDFELRDKIILPHKKCSGPWKGEIAIANEIVFSELRFRNVTPARLAKALGLTEKVLMQVLRFELDETEQLRMVQLINSIAA